MSLNQNRIVAIFQIPTQKTKRQVQEYLNMDRYCYLWILGIKEISKPLYTRTNWCTESLIPIETDQKHLRL